MSEGAPWRRALRSGLDVLERPLLAFALVGCASLPSRLALASEQAAGTSRALLLAGGLLMDVATLGPAFVVAFEIFAWRSRRGRRASTVGLAIILFAFVACLLVQNGGTEFRLERGVAPTAMDVRQGLGHHDFLSAELPQLLGGRFLLANLLAAAAALATLTRMRHRAESAGRKSAHALAHALGLAFAVCLALVFASRRAEAFYARMRTPHALTSHPATIVKGLAFAGGYDGSPAEVRRVLAEYRGGDGDAALGARNMGFDPRAAERITSADCARHPLERSLSGEEEGEEEADLVRAARDVSKELFRDGAAPTIVFHVSLEGVGADDIHALESNAPETIAPFLDEVFSSSSTAVAFAHAHQSGVRTSQALSAVMCGLGVLPFNISLARDLGTVPLRCLPDVLGDARFRARAFYGHEFVFDDMSTFLHAHGFTLHERSDFPASAPRGVWSGVSDAAVYAAAAADSDAQKTEIAQYNFVLTLSHHAPYTTPDDLSSEAASSIGLLCRTRDLDEESCDRLKTLRYADDSLRGFIARIEKSRNASRTIVLVAADHTVHRRARWTSDAREAGLTKIPMFVWVPDAMKRSVADPTAFAAAWARLQEHARTRPISSSDVPIFLLALVGASAQLRALPPPAQWHTLGGQTTSRHYRSITGRGVLHGVDAHGNMFDVSDSGVVRPGPEMDGLRGPDDVARATAENRPAIALWGSFFRDWVPRCASSAHR